MSLRARLAEDGKDLLPVADLVWRLTGQSAGRRVFGDKEDDEVDDG